MHTKLHQEISNRFERNSVIVPATDYLLKQFPAGWGIRIEVPDSCDLGSANASSLLTKIKDVFGFIILVSDAAWRSSEPVLEQVQISKDLQIPHLEYIHVPTCVIHVPAGKPVRRSKTLLLSEEVFRNCLTDFGKEQGEEVVKHNGNYRLPSWVNNRAVLHEDSPRFTEILMEKYSSGVHIHNWSHDKEQNQMLVICNSDAHASTTYHCRFGEAHDYPIPGMAVQNLFVKKAEQAIEAGDFVRV